MFNDETIFIGKLNNKINVLYIRDTTTQKSIFLFNPTVFPIN